MLVRVDVHLGLDHLMIEVVALAGALADAGEDGIAAMRLRDIVDQFHDQNGLADTGAPEQADLAAFRIGREQVDDLDPGDEDLRFRRLVGVGGRRLVDGAAVLGLDGAEFVDRLADDVDDATERLVADRHHDRSAGIGNRLAAGQALGDVHGDAAHAMLAEMLGHFEDEPVAVVRGFQRVQDLRHVAVELHVDDGADDLDDMACRLVGGGGGFGHGLSFCVSGRPVSGRRKGSRGDGVRAPLRPR